MQVIGRRFAWITILVPLLSCWSYAGEWISAGNAPPPPYHPHAPVTVACQATVITSAHGKLYRIDPRHVFQNSDFQTPGSGVVEYEIKGESDPGMNGQWYAFAFQPNASGNEDMSLRLQASLDDLNGKTYRASSYALAARQDRKVSGTVELELPPDKENPQGRSVSLRVDCKVD